MGNRSRLWTLEDEGPQTRLVELSDDVRAAREAYLNDFEADFQSTKRAGAVEDDTWLVDSERWLHVHREPWWRFDTRGCPPVEIPVAGLDGSEVSL